MTLLASRRALLVALENTEGTDAAPTAQANAIQATNLELTPLQANVLDRELVKPHLGANQQLLDGVHAQLGFEVELASAGLAGSAPKWNVLLRACGFRETVNPPGVAASRTIDGLVISQRVASATLQSVNIAGGGAGTPPIITEVNSGNTLSVVFEFGVATRADIIAANTSANYTIELAEGEDESEVWAPGAQNAALGGYAASEDADEVAFSPRSEGFESATIYLNRDGNLHKLTGARGTVVFAVAPGAIPRMRFNFLGRYNAVEAAARPQNVDTSGFQKPVLPRSATLPVLSFGGQNIVGANLELDCGQQVQFTQWLNAEGIEITDRAGAGTLEIRDPGVVVRDYFANAYDGTPQALTVQLGSEAGSIIELEAPRAQLLQPRYGERENVQTLQFDLTLLPSDTGNDELKVTAR